MAYKDGDEVVKGTTWFFPVSIEDTQADNPDYTQYKAYFTIKKTLEDSDEDAIYFDDLVFDSGGHVEFIIEPELTKGYPAGYWHRAVKVIGPDVQDEIATEFTILESGVKTTS